MTDMVIDLANAAGERWAHWALVSLLESALLFALVSGIWMAIRSRVAPQAGYLLFLLLPLKLLLPIGIATPPALARWVPSTVIANWLDVPTSRDLPVTQIDDGEAWNALPDPVPLPEGDLAVSSPPLQQHRAERSVAQEMGDAAINRMEATARSEITGNRRAPRFSAAAWILLAWLSLVLAMVGRWGVVQWRFWRVVRELPEFDGTKRGVNVIELCQRVGLRTPVRFVESDAMSVPAVWGILGPTIIVPRQIGTDLTARQLTWLLLHELAHVHRYDLLVALFQRVALILNFFNPVVWMANRMADCLREFACDDLATARCETSPTETGEAFLQVLRSALRAPKRLRGALGLFGVNSKSACLRRVRRMLDSDGPRPLGIGRPLRLAILLIAVLSLPYLQAASETPKSPPGSSPPAADSTSSNSPERPVQADDQGADDATSTRRFELRIVGPDGKPLSKVPVELRSKTFPEPRQVTVGTYDRKGPYGLYMTTDEEGRLVFEAPRRATYFELFVRLAGFGPYCARWSSETHPAPIPERFQIELEAAWTAGGIIVDPEGKPVEGVVIHPSIEFKKRPGDNRQYSGGSTVKTDATGRWRYESVPNSMRAVFVEISDPRFKPDRRSLTRVEFGIAENGEPGATIALDPGLAVTGMVTDEAGSPIGDAVIRTKFLNDIRETKSMADGTYRLGGCEPVGARIVVSAKGRATDMQDVRLTPELGPIDFQMRPGGHVRIRVVDQTGQPVPKARIFFQGWRGGRFSYFEFKDVDQYADINGIWEWNEAPLDEFKADICPPEGISLTEQSIVARDEEYVFKTFPPLVITGRVIDAETRKPVEKFDVLPGVRSSESHMNWVEGERFKSAAGTFTVRRTDGYFAHLVRVEAPGYLAAVSRDIKSDEGNVAMDFELRRGKDVLAKVVDQNLRPVDGAKVALGVAGSQISIVNGDITPSQLTTQVQTDKTGKFTFPPQSTDFQLVITHPSGFAHLKATPDWPNLKIIRLEPWARVEGTFRVGPKTVGNVPITINTHNPHSYGKDVPSIFTHHDVTTGPNGEFAFERVFPGKASIGKRIMLTVSDGATEATSACMVPADFPGGKTSRVELGGTGQPAVGTLAPPEGFAGKVLWNFALIEVSSESADPEHPGAQFYASVDREGQFRIDDMPPGKYTLTVSFSKDRPGFIPPHDFVVPVDQDKGAERRVDLGTLKLRKNP